MSKLTEVFKKRRQKFCCVTSENMAKHSKCCFYATNLWHLC